MIKNKQKKKTLKIVPITCWHVKFSSLGNSIQSYVFGLLNISELSGKTKNKMTFYFISANNYNNNKKAQSKTTHLKT